MKRVQNNNDHIVTLRRKTSGIVFYYLLFQLIPVSYTDKYGGACMQHKQKNADHWNAYLYDRNHAFVSHYGNELIDLLHPKAGEKILDLG